MKQSEIVQEIQRRVAEDMRAEFRRRRYSGYFEDGTWYEVVLEDLKVDSISLVIEWESGP